METDMHKGRQFEDIQGENDCVMDLQVKECQRLWATLEARRNRKYSSLGREWAHRNEHGTADALILDFQPPELWDSEFLLFLSFTVFGTVLPQPYETNTVVWFGPYMFCRFNIKCIPKYFMCLDIFVNDSGFENKFLIFHCSFLYVEYVS